MLRATASAVIAFLLLPLWLPFAHLDTESSLPPCCRGHGKCHCALMARVRSLEQNGGPALRSAPCACPFCSLTVSLSKQVIMLRATASTVIAFLLLPLCLPLVPPHTESSLPACCRGNGKHRCRCALMARLRSSEQSQTAGPALRSANDACPCRSLLFVRAAPHGMGVPAHPTWRAQVVSHPRVILQAVLQARNSEARNHHERGPPSFLG